MASATIDVLCHFWALKAYKRSHLVLTLTDEDQKSFEAAAGWLKEGKSYSSMYFGYRDTSSSDKKCRPSSARKLTVLIAANFWVPENERSALKFLEAVWPKVRQAIAAELIFAGSSPTAAFTRRIASAGSGVRLCASPTHHEMERIYSEAFVSVATAVNGSGIKLRVAESLRRRTPVVSTRHSARGYDGVAPAVLRIYETPQEAAEQICGLVKAAPETIGQQCEAEYRRLFSFEAGLKRMEYACRGVLS